MTDMGRYGGAVAAVCATVLVVSCLHLNAFADDFADPAPGPCDGISTASSHPLTKVPIATGLSSPTFVASPPGDLSRIVVLQQGGVVTLVKDLNQLSTPFLDLTAITLSPSVGGGSEQGLLGLAFHPQYATNGWAFVYHTDRSGNNVLARYTRSAANPDVLDASTRQVLMTLSHPGQVGHNGGMLAFGPQDGYLYIGIGDGSLGCAPLNYTSNWGKLLRINVNALPYTIPPTNPYAGNDGKNDEIWASGLRNPWRFSFDRSVGDLYLGDVGENAWEEIDWRRASSTGGENYGWPNLEGNSCGANPCPGTTCTLPNYVAPVVVYDHSVYCAVIGGYVYRGCRMPDLAGAYFYGDECGFVRTFRMVNGAVTDAQDRTSELSLVGNLTSFGEDARGELYFTQAGWQDRVYRLVPLLSNLEVSGAGAAMFQLGKTAWTWEDLHATSAHPITTYRVYRSASRGNGTFDCVYKGTTTSWALGDVARPNAGQVYSYVVTALNAAGTQTSPGRSTSGTPRTLSALACP